MKRAAALFEQSGKTLDQLGQAMGYEGEVARKSAWQFLNKTADPRLSMLRRFCAAMNISLEELISEPADPKKKKGQPNQAGPV